MYDDMYWSSSPMLYDYGANFLRINSDSITLNDTSSNSDRNYYYRVRCLKDNTLPTLNYRWQTDSTCSSNADDYTSTSRDSYDASNTTATATVTTS